MPPTPPSIIDVFQKCVDIYNRVEDQGISAASWARQAYERIGNLSIPQPIDIANQVVETLKNAVVTEVTAMLQQFFTELQNFLKSMFKEPAVIPAPVPMNPQIVIDQIASAIHSAEVTLNKQSLVIGSGTIELNVTVGDGSAGGAAQAKITFTIQPRN